MNKEITVTFKGVPEGDICSNYYSFIDDNNNENFPEDSAKIINCPYSNVRNEYGYETKGCAIFANSECCEIDSIQYKCDLCKIACTGIITCAIATKEE